SKSPSITNCGGEAALRYSSTGVKTYGRSACKAASVGSALARAWPFARARIASSRTYASSGGSDAGATAPCSRLVAIEPRPLRGPLAPLAPFLLLFPLDGPPDRYHLGELGVVLQGVELTRHRGAGLSRIT